MADILGRQFTNTDLGGGKRRLLSTIHDQRILVSGYWTDVAESLVNDGADGYAKKCMSMRHGIRLGTGGTRRWYPRSGVLGEYLDITEIGNYTNRWRTLTLPTPVWKAGGAEWDMTNLYAAVSLNWHRVKTEFILKNSSASAYTRLRFAVALTGLTLNTTTWALTSVADGTVVGRITPPWAVDATGARVLCSATYSGGYIEWSVDTTGMMFPIAVDPTLTVQPDAAAGKDSWMKGNWDWEGLEYGSNDSMNVGNLGGGNYCHALVSFDLSSGTAGATVDDATLTLRVTYNGGNAFTCYFHRLASANEDWTEAHARWSERKDGSNWAGSSGASTSGTDYTATAAASESVPAADNNWDVELATGQVSDWLGYTKTLLMIADGATSYAEASVATSDHATSSYRPKMVVNYTEAASGGCPRQMMHYARLSR